MNSRKYNEYTQPVKALSPPAKLQEQIVNARASTCSDDIYMNTALPEEAAPGPPDHNQNKSSGKAKALKTSLQVVKQPSPDSDAKNKAEAFYSSLDLSQKQEQDVYEEHQATMSTHKPQKQELLELVELPARECKQEEENEERRQTNKVMLYLRRKKTILAAICIFFLAFVASLLGSLIIGSVIIKNIEIIMNTFITTKNNNANTITINKTLTLSSNETTEYELQQSSML